MRVLVVEDETKMATLLKRGLEHKGYAVDLAGDGAEALWAAREFDFDAIVLDAMIPEPDGFEVCRTLRSEGRWTPVLLLTARDAVDDRVLGLDAGADDYLTKPFAIAELLARLLELARRRTFELQSPRLELADLTMDLVRHEVMRDGTPIELTPREYALLEYFLRHPGQVLTRTQILENVWRYDAYLTSNAVDTYVHYLRDKIDRGHEPKLLRTIRGVGYALRAS